MFRPRHPPRRRRTRPERLKERRPRTRIDDNDGPIRTCAGCRTRKPQRELIRVARMVDGAVVVDPAGSQRRAQGRGAYVCPDPDCIDRALRSGGLSRTLKHDGVLPEDLRDRLLGRIGGSTTV